MPRRSGHARHASITALISASVVSCSLAGGRARTDARAVSAGDVSSTPPGDRGEAGEAGEAPAPRELADAAPSGRSATNDMAQSTGSSAGAPTPSTATVSTPAGARAALRAAGHGALVDALDRRVRQRAAKMKLSAEQAGRAAQALERELAGAPALRELAGVMPRSTVELARAIEGRGLAREEAIRIAQYLLSFVEAMQLGNLAQLDENHSHVIGREWREIDYSGERMTWQGQRDAWAPKGVLDFKRALHIHRYFASASRLPYFTRIYRPRGHMPPAPESEDHEGVSGRARAPGSELQ